MQYKALPIWSRGYGTIITHLQFALKILAPQRAEMLLQVQPKLIKEQLLNEPFSGHLIYADLNWTPEIPIDLEVGDAVLLDFSAIANEPIFGSNTKPHRFPFHRTNDLELRRLALKITNRSAFVRISRKGFTGRSILPSFRGSRCLSQKSYIQQMFPLLGLTFSIMSLRHLARKPARSYWNSMP